VKFGAYFNLESFKTKKVPRPPLFPYSTGWQQARGSNALVAEYSSYLNSALSFATVESGIVGGVSDPRQFATNLQQLGKFGIGPHGPIPSFISTLVSIINQLGQCLQ
jgi:hypothetical protein